MNPKFARLSTLATLVAFAARLNGAVTEGLLGHWTFDETTGATAKDASGNGHDGSVSNFSGDAPPWTTGQIGGGLGFRGPENGDAVIVPAFPEITNTFTISAWVWADGRDGTWPESAIVHSAGATGAGPLGLLIRPKNRDQAFGPLGHTTLAAGGIVAVSEAIGFPVAGWQQVGVVADGSKIHLYRNGVEVGSADYAPPLSPPPSPELGLGVSPDDGGAPGGAFWFGKLDDIGIWQRALTAGQMAAIFNAGQAGKDLTQADAYENVPPTITTQPLSITRFVGEVASFSVAAAGTGTLSYQWKRDGNPIAGATNATYSIGSVKSLDAGEYIVTVTNAGGTKDSQPARLTVQTVTVSTGLIGYWKFDESQGEVASDASGNNNNATLYNYTGDNSQWVAGQVGGALSFGGADAMQYLLVPDYPKPASTLTVSAWVWAETIGAWTSFVKNWGSSDAGQFHFGLAGDGVHENIYIKQVDGKTPNTSDRQPFPTNSWQHVAFVCDGSNVRLYRNGVEVASTTYNGTLVTPPMNCVGVGVKMANDCVDPDGGNPGWLHGKMDDLAIWNRGLSPSEMVAVYQAGLGGKGVLEASTSAVFSAHLFITC
ncbi:MAG: LamG-like jellyroll fold domain-containing protein [Verrucomicrobiota bacterium]